MLFASTCAGCGCAGHCPCAACIDALVPLGDICVPGLDRCSVLMEYDPLSLRLIGALKYYGQRSGVPWLARALAERVAGLGEQFGVVTWVPASRRSRRLRGFDQSKLLARPVAAHLGVPARPLLVRADQGRQTGKGRAGRLAGPSLLANRGCAEMSVVLLDDVITTGASMAAAARTLRGAGAREVFGVAVAHRTFQPLEHAM